MNAPVDTLEVNALTQPILPSAGVPGIFFGSTTGGALTVRSDTGGFGIVTTGSNAHGIHAETSQGLTIGNPSLTNGNIVVESAGSVETNGDSAVGIAGANVVSTALDIVGPAIATGGNVVVTNNGSVLTRGNSASAIGGYAFVRAASTDDDASAISGDVSITNNGSVETEGESYGIHAESRILSTAMGTGSAIARGARFDVNGNGTITTHRDGVRAITVIGLTDANATSALGENASASSGGVSVTSGAIEAFGFEASGIVVSDTVRSTTNGTGFAQTTNGEIIVAPSGPILMHGDKATGIYAFGGVSAIAADGGATATGGGVKIDAGDITVTGANAGGMTVETYAQAFSNVAATATAKAGDIVVDSKGTISALAHNGFGILARSGALGSGSAEAGDISVNVVSGSVTGGTGWGAAIVLEGGNDNKVTNAASISALSGLAVVASFGNDTVDNFGFMDGTVALGSGTNALTNHVGGTYSSGVLAYVGAGNTFRNDGNLTPGGAGTIRATEVVGDFVQSATGSFKVNADWTTATSDMLYVQGTATLAGTVVVLPSNFPSSGGLIRKFLIVHATDGAVDDGIAVSDTAAVNYAILFDPGGNDVYLTASTDFAVDGLNRNQTAIARNINAIQAAGGTPGFTPVADALSTLTTQAALANALDQLSPELFSYANIETLFAAEQFSQDLLSCSVADGSGAAFIREGQCIWARGRARFLDLETTTHNIGADASVGSFSGGIQLALSPDWRLAVAAGYDNVSIDTGSDARADGDRANVGAAIKYNPGPLLLAVAASGGWTSFDTRRAMSFGGFNHVATGDSDVNYATGRVHAAYLLDQGGWYMKPLVDGTVTYLDADGLREQGGGGAALTVGGSNETIVSVSPALEIGGELRLGELSVLRPFLRAGVTWRDSDNLDLGASFAAAPPGVGGFTIETALDDVLADVSAGIDIINAEGAALRIQYDGRFGAETAQNSASLKGSVPF